MQLKIKLPKTINFHEILVNNLSEVLIAVMFFSVFLFGSETQRLDFWLSCIVILTLLRFVLSFFYGFKLWPQAKFDLAFLTFLTGIIILSIVNSGENGPSNLGGTNVWGIGMMMLTSLSIYFVYILLHNRKSLGKIFALVLNTGAFLAILLANFGGVMTNGLANLALIQILLGIYLFSSVKQRWVQYLLIIFGVNSLIMLVKFPIYPEIALAGFVLFKVAALSQLKQFRKDGSKVMLNNLLQNSVVRIGIAGLVVFVLSMIVLVVTGNFSANFNNFFTPYSSFVKSISADKIVALLVGTGLTATRVPAVTLIASYGLAGVLLVCYPLLIIIRNLKNLAVKSEFSVSKLMLISMNILVIASIVFGGLTLNHIILFVFTLASLFANTTERKADSENLAIVNFTKVKSRGLRIFLQVLRALVAIVIVGYSFYVIGLIVNIF